jgi:hypothetical protein
MANGSYKMTGDAKTFYETVNAFKLDGFRNAIVSVEEEFTKLNNIKSSGKDFNYESLIKSAFNEDKDRFSSQLVRDQLDYLAAANVNGRMSPQLDAWEADFSDKKMNPKTL